MKRLVFALALFGLTTASAVARAPADGWGRLKVGMSPREALQQLGEPLMRTRGNGFERWIYDGCGELVFQGGPLAAWTAATPSATSLSRPIAQDVLYRGTPRGRATALVAAPNWAETETRFRYR